MAQSTTAPPDASITLPDVQTTAAAPAPAPARNPPPAPLYGNWTPAFFQPHRRSIGGIVAQVTIEEQGSDDVQITEHPVEQGAPIADHAFKRPANVTIRAGWSRQYAWDLSAETGVYGLLLSWQASLIPFNVITGKRSYSNMLIERLQITTDQHTEFALMATITCRQVIIVGTATTEVTGMSNDGNSHADASSTGPSTDNGTKQGDGQGSVQDKTGSWRESDAVAVPSEQNVTGTPEAGTITGSPVATTPESKTIEQGYIDNNAAPPNNPTVQYEPHPGDTLIATVPYPAMVVPLPNPSVGTAEAGAI